MANLSRGPLVGNISGSLIATRQYEITSMEISLAITTNVAVDAGEEMVYYIRLPKLKYARLSNSTLTLYFVKYSLSESNGGL